MIFISDNNCKRVDTLIETKPVYCLRIINMWNFSRQNVDNESATLIGASTKFSYSKNHLFVCLVKNNLTFRISYKLENTFHERFITSHTAKAFSVLFREKCYRITGNRSSMLREFEDAAKRCCESDGRETYDFSSSD